MPTRREGLLQLGGWLGMAALPGAAVAAGSRVVIVPFERSEDGAPIISLTIDGKGPFRFLLDTGSETNLIRDELARRLGLQHQGAIRNEGLQKSRIGGVYTAQNVEFTPEFKVPVVTFTTSYNPLSSLPDGLLPAGFLTAIPSELDFDAREIRLYPEGGINLTGYESGAMFLRQPSRELSPSIFAYITLEGRAVKVLFDTGCSVPVYLSSAFVQKNGLWDRYPEAKQVDMHGMETSKVSTRAVRMDDVNIGGFHFDGVDVFLAHPASEDMLRAQKLDAIVGIPLLRQFNIVIANGTDAYLKPNTAFNGSRLKTP